MRQRDSLYIPGEITGVLVESKGLVVERLGPAVGHELKKLRLVARENGAIIQLVSWQNESALEAFTSWLIFSAYSQIILLIPFRFLIIIIIIILF